ncbi:MAG: AbrB/MazE/SpoVT family DNA-binding domain-containing protein [Halobacteriota archaeon]|nr:AbrB/MazE/SpoVT family DNA-binding domain-containing protein [Halobacteriota archaeon]MDY6958648.1 AbrB/MazE/SpoVT family DNA-binding domain-containing protein [Halobacteriota archaeon]
MKNILTVDQNGRIVIPMKVRKIFNTNKFEIHVDDEKIELIPVKSIGTLFGTLKELKTDSKESDSEE